MSFEIKEKVQEYYGQRAKKVASKGKTSCCSKISNDEISSTSKIYSMEELLRDLPDEALQASLGCANPVVTAQLKEGEVVLDLGSGGGIDVLMASKVVGPNGKVYGLDMTDEMLSLANSNKEKIGVKNVEFIKGCIEEIPLEDNSVDVIISNCVINLSEDKGKVLKEAYRVLKPGGRFSVADIVALKGVPEEIRKAAELWYGCIAGTLEKNEYYRLLEEAGFSDISLEPIHVYGKRTIEEFVKEKSSCNGGTCNSTFSSIDMDLIDGAFAGSVIKAVKER